MSDRVSGFVEYTKAPWGQMHYEMVRRQLPLAGSGLRVLDFGSGIGMNAAYYAQSHDVIAVEPDAEMIKNAIPGGYTQIHGDIGVLDSLAEPFDVILCHNVLEYVDDREAVFSALTEHLRQGGLFSLIKHNEPGKVFQTAVFSADPAAAVALLNGGQATSAMFGNVRVYDNSGLLRLARRKRYALEGFYGLRCFWALIQDNAIKSDPAWREKMLNLETAVQELSPYRDAAYNHHFIFTKLSADGTPYGFLDYIR